MLYADVARLARKYLAVQASSAASEPFLAGRLGGDGKAQAHDGGHSGRHHIPPREPETQAVVVCC